MHRWTSRSVAKPRPARHSRRPPRSCRIVPCARQTSTWRLPQPPEVSMANAAVVSGVAGRVHTRRVAESTRRALWAYLFIAPFYVSFLVFGVFPIIFSFYLAMTRWTPYQSVWIGA